MRVVFLGTPEFAVPSLRALREAGHEVALVVTQPDRPSSRGQKEMAAPPVKLAAAGIDVLQPEDVNVPEALARVRAASPEVLVVVAFGQKMGPELLAMAPRGCVNAHASLLPKFRGASPVSSAILKGHAQTGVTIMRIAERMDAGPVLLQRATAIGAEETTDGLEERLSLIGAELLAELLAAWSAGRDVPETAQDESRATYARKLKKEDGLIPWTRPVRRVDCHIRAMSSWPGAFTFLLKEGKPPQRIAVRRARPNAEPAAAAPGDVLGLDDTGLRVGTGEGTIDLIELQPENRRAMDARSFVNGWRVERGDRFGSV
ncbi:MAG: methionyl-tRNA formyltransferase [Planctomycetota bacterium]